MVVGRFDPVSGHPTVDCHVTIKSLGIDGVVPFLVDTGADTSLLMPIDSLPLKIPFEKLTNERDAYGLGGCVKVACTRFRRRRVRCFYGTGGESWRDGSLPESSSLRRCG